MTTNTQIQNIDLWEAWVDMQGTRDGAAPIVYVIGEICVNNTILEPRFEKMPAPAGMENQLVLQIVPNILSEEGLETEILYAEDLKQPHQYKGVTVFAGNEIVVEMNTLEYIY